MANQPADDKAADHRVAIATAVIGAVATLGAATIAAVVAYDAGSNTPSANTTVTATVTSAVTSTVTVAATSPPETSPTRPTTEPPDRTTPEPPKPPDPSGTVRFHGKVALQEDIGGVRTDLDLETPTKTEAFVDGDVYAWGLSNTEAKVGATPGYSLVAGWTGTGTPDFDQCRRTALSEGGDTVSDVRRGSILCVRTSDHRIARLTVVDVMAYAGIRAETVVWDEPAA